MPFFEITYTDGTVEEVEADEYRALGQNVTFVNYRVLFVTTIYQEIVRRLDRHAVLRVDVAVAEKPRAGVNLP